MAAESLAGIQVLQAFTMEDESSRRFGRLSGSTLQAALDAVRVEARFGPAVDLCGALATAAVLWFGAHRVMSGELSLGVMLVFLTYLAVQADPRAVPVELPAQPRRRVGRADQRRAVGDP